MQDQRRILVVDDDAEVRRILVTSVRHRGLAADEASSGAEAIDLLRENRYGVVLLDLMMPGVDGFAVLGSIEQDANAPIVLVVSGADRRLLDQLDSSRIHGIVKKPFDPLEVAGIVAACAEIRGRSPFETMAYATLITGAPLLALLGTSKLT
jgi:CheY-like chemotaxis protein